MPHFRGFCHGLLTSSTTEATAYFRCLSLLPECPRRKETEFLFRMELHRGTPALQKLLRPRGLRLDDLKSKFGSRFLEVFDLLVAVPFLVMLHSFTQHQSLPCQ